MAVNRILTISVAIPSWFNIMKIAKLIVTAGIAVPTSRDIAVLPITLRANPAAPAETALATRNIMTAAIILGMYP
ncbi:hypothetical protein D3C87_1613550 [compost metagenome]